MHQIARFCAVFCRSRAGRLARAVAPVAAAAFLLVTACQSGDPTGGLGPPATGILSVAIQGLPAGVPAAVTVTNSQGFQRSLVGPETLTGLAPGVYTVTAGDLVLESDRYAPAPSTQNVTVTAGTAAAVVSVAYVLTTGRLAVTVTGVPAGATAAILVTGPAGYSHPLAAPETLLGLVPGTYTVHAPSIVASGDRYDAQAESQDVVVAASDVPAAASVAYSPATGRLLVDVAGLPAGTGASMTVTGPGGFSQTLSGGQMLTGLAPGSYLVTAASVPSDGYTYSPNPASQNAGVSVGATANAGVVYAASTGSLALTVSGLPGGINGSVTVAGPGGFSQTITSSQTLSGLLPGGYTVAAASVSSGASTYAPAPGIQTVPVSAGTTAPATVAYTIATGLLTVTVSGLPGGTNASVTVTGPGGFSQNLTATQTLSGLTPGSYTIAGSNVASGGSTYAPAPVSQSKAVSAGATAAASVIYAATTGGLTVTISGLPGGTNASVTVTGPGGFSQNLTATQTLNGLTAGGYTVTAASVTSGSFGYSPVPGSQSVTVSGGATASASVTYSASTGGLTVTISGLPGGTNASVTVTGPGGFSQNLTATQTLSGLTPGSYTIAGSNVASGGFTYAPAPVSQSKAVSAGATAAASVSYAATTGSLTVTISGLPGGTSANVTVTGPGGFSQNLTATQTLTGLTPGSYTIAASNVASGGFTYAPAPVSQSKAVSAGATAAAGVSYSPSGGGPTLDLSVNGVYLTQAAQKYDGSVPLVAGRDAYLRVFALANQANTAAPQVRVRLYSGAVLVQTYTIAAPSLSVPTAVNEGSLVSSWNVLVPAALVQPNLKVLADVDPANGVAESDESDNQFPSSGTPGPVDVRALPTYMVRFVPVLQQANGTQGNVTVGNTSSFLADPKLLLPIGAFDADVRAVYTTTAPALDSGNSNGAWGTILSEVLALRGTDGSTRYYYGVVHTTYGSGVAGIGYVGGSARAAIGWDNLPSGSNVMAHETGHNMGRQHAPCGGAGSPDPAYPYAGGAIGVWGLNVTTLALKAPTLPDLMGYCNPNWVSDYNWSAMVTYRQGGPNNAPPAAGVVADSGLLVWGRITDTGVVLEPAFKVGARPDLAPRPGPYRLQLLGRNGSLAGSLSFEATEVADLPGGVERHFAFVLPLDPALEQDLAEIRVLAGTRIASRVSSSSGAPAVDPEQRLTRAGAQQVEVTWNPSRYPMVMVRDAATGQVLSFARGGAARLWTRSGRFDLIFSDGVRSVRRQGRTLQ